MCGRFANALQAQAYRDAVQAQIDGMRRRNRNNNDQPDDQDQYDFHFGLNPDAYHPSHNIAPQTRSPILRLGDKPSSDSELGPSADPPLVLDTMKWGLVQKSAKVPPTGLDAARSINARDDTILRGSIWSPLFPRQRCILFVQGFYEWQHKERIGSKDEIIAHFIGLDKDGKGRVDKDGKQKALLAIACLWEKCRFHGDDEDTYTFTIVTTAANKQMHFNLDQVAKLMKPFEHTLEVYPCPREVGKVGTDNPAFILPINQRKDGIMAAFGRAKPNKKMSSSIVEESTTSKTAKGGKDLEKLEEDGRADEQVVMSRIADESIREENADVKASEPGSDPDSKQRQLTEEETRQARKPSSRFSPEPWNPPLSTPPGEKSSWLPYKRTHQATRESPREEPKTGNASLESAFKRQEKRKRDEDEFKKEVGLDEGEDGSDGFEIEFRDHHEDEDVAKVKDVEVDEKQKKRKTINDDRRDDGAGEIDGSVGQKAKRSKSRSPQKGKSEIKKPRKDESPSPRKGNKDIRSFFK